MSKKNKTGNLANLSAKIKHVYIELNRYSFFHNPSNVKMQDTRFIGREKLIERLKIILSHNETRSGAYLITGFRGVGKTTFVNRVISEVTVQSSERSKWADFKSVLFYLIVLMVFNGTLVDGILEGKEYQKELYRWIVCVLAGISWIILNLTDPKKQYIGNSIFNYIKNFICINAKIILMIKTRSTEYKYRRLVHNVFLILTIHLASILLKDSFKGITWVLNTFHIVIFIFILFLSLISSYFCNQYKTFRNCKNNGNIKYYNFTRN